MTLAESPVRGGWELEPREGGLFLGRKIVLDGEGEDPWHIGVVRDLSRRLEEAGAAVVQIPWNRNLRMEDRVLAANRAGGDFLLSLSVDPPGKKPAVEYYYSSGEGKRLAGTVASSLGIEAKEGGHFMVVHTGLRAVRLGFPTEEPPDLIAEKIYRGMADFLKGEGLKNTPSSRSEGIR